MNDTDTDKDKSGQQQETDPTSKVGERKRKSISEKLRDKLEKLKKEDPNIYPVF